MTQPHVVGIPIDATVAERAYLEALQRLVDNEPRHLASARVAGGGSIRPSQPTVATEAGRSRTPISGKACALPRVQLAIKRAQNWYRDSKRPEGTLQELAVLGREQVLRRERNYAKQKSAYLKQQRDAAYTSSAACGMLAVAIQQSNRAANVDITKLRRAAEQKAISNRSPSAL